MSILKPEYLSGFDLSSEYMDKLDIEMLIKCLHLSWYKAAQDASTTYLLDVHREGSYKSSYEFLPKAFKLKISEYRFYSLRFNYDAFYEHQADIVQIKIDYCEYILKDYPSAKRTLKLFKKLKLNHAEYFI